VALPLPPPRAAAGVVHHFHAARGECVAEAVGLGVVFGGAGGDAFGDECVDLGGLLAEAGAEPVFRIGRRLV
jgi:hypothetical protein